MKKRPLNLLGILTVSIAATSTASAQRKIGVQFTSSRTSSAVSLSSAEVAGTATTKQSNWNYTSGNGTGNITNIAGPTSGALINDQGISTATTVEWKSNSAWENTNNNGATSNTKLLAGYLDNSPGAQTGTVTLDKIPYQVYNVVVYYGGGNNGVTGKITGTSINPTISYSYSTKTNFGRAVTESDFVQSRDIASGNPSSNFCIFQNLVSTTFTFNVDRGNGNSGIHAIQIIEILDADGDGMPNAYENANGLNPNLDDRLSDLDLDGVLNFDEFTNGTKPNNPDTDTDGLSDGVETKTDIYVSPTNTGSDPLKPDTDGDGINDGPEVATGVGDPYVTNPVKADTDGDGYSDSYEITKGTDPTLITSTPALNVAGRIGINFARGQDQGNFNVVGSAGAGAYAQSNWNNKSGDNGINEALVDAANVAVPAKLQWSANSTYAGVVPGSIPADGNGELMAGYLDSSNDSTTNVTVSNVPYQRYDLVVYVNNTSDGNFATYSANNVIKREFGISPAWPVVAGGGTFVEIAARGQTGYYLVFRNLTGGTLKLTSKPDAFGGAPRAPICGIQIISAFDGDSDGMPDVYEDQFEFDKTSPADGNLDADADGLTNAAEYRADTQPRQKDTDNDGLFDGVETNTGLYVSPSNTGTKPLDPDGDDDGLKDGAETVSNPVKQDTDGDGFFDGYEVTNNLSPVDPAIPATNVRRSVGIKFNTGDSNALSAADTAGWARTLQKNWNNAYNGASGNTTNLNFDPNNTSRGVLRDNAGTSTTMTVEWNASGAYFTGTGNVNPDSKLMNSYLDDTGTGCKITLGSIPYSSYDVIAYFGSDGNNRSGSAISSTANQEFFFTTYANFFANGFSKNAYLQTSDTDLASPTPRANFCRFSGQTTPDFVLEIKRGDNNCGLFALQVVDATQATIPVVSITRAPSGQVTVVWVSEASASYRVQSSPDLTTWATLNENYPSAGTTTSYTDTTLPAVSPKWFYRVIRN